jgi:hypothetical protein
MKSLADGLPPEIAQQIHPDWRKNEDAYWAVREQLLAQYQGQWIGFADGKVVASGRSPVAVCHAAVEAAEHPFVTCVGHEDHPTRMRRETFSASADRCVRSWQIRDRVKRCRRLTPQVGGAI